jgi:hypothetical protein
MYRPKINIKPKCGQQTGKALSNHESLSPSQSHETVPLNLNFFALLWIQLKLLLLLNYLEKLAGSGRKLFLICGHIPLYCGYTN